MKRYFQNCETIEDVKSRFRDLAKQLHPDCGGSAEGFRSMMDQYREAFERYKETHRNQKGETYRKETTETPEQFSGIIESLLRFEGVVIEIIGSWVWLTGNTKPYKEEIKALGFFWSSSKSAWYYNGDTQKSHRRGHYSMNGLRNKWGSTVVEEEDKTRRIG